MVKLEEVLDEEFANEQVGPIDEDDWDTDDESDASSVSSVDEGETLAERLAALQDIIPPSYRRSINNTVSTTSSWAKTGLLWGGKALWVVSTSAILVVVPWALAYGEEQQMIEMEREMKMQQSAGDIFQAQGGDSTAQPAQAQPASS